MVQRRDNRYRGRQNRRAAPPKRKPGHLRTNYTDNDPTYFFLQDLKTVHSEWPEELLAEDRKALRRERLKELGITLLITMIPVTALAVWCAIDGMPWWIVPAMQTFIILYLLILFLVNRFFKTEEKVDVLIYCEADRRGIKYVKGKTPLSNIMNRINHDYNSHLWNRNFKWE